MEIGPLQDCLISRMGIPILGRQHLYIEAAPQYFLSNIWPLKNYTSKKYMLYFGNIMKINGCSHALLQPILLITLSQLIAGHKPN